MRLTSPMTKCITLSKTQKGFSLIELMVAMTVGLFLLAGVVTHFTSTTANNRVRDAISEMDATASIVFDALRPAIAHAGYTGIDNIRLALPFYTRNEFDSSNGRGVNNVNCGGVGNNGILWSGDVKGYTREDGKKDRITVVSMADNPCEAGLPSCGAAANINPDALVYTDCRGGGNNTADPRVVSCSTDTANGGMTDPSQAKIYSTFYLMTSREFFCQGSRGGTLTVANNIEAVKYLYGVRDSNGGIYYRSGTQVSNQGQWGEVSSVQVGLLVRSAESNILAKLGADKHFVLRFTINIADRDRRRLFKVYTTTISLNNVN